MVSSIKLSSGYEIPIIGIGTWKSSVGQVEKAINDAIDIGYRHIDCAYVYGNEKEVGSAITNKINSGVVKREDLFITSKLWNIYHNPAHVKEALMRSLKNLNVEYLDLYLIHWPFGYKYTENGENLFPKDGDDWLFSDDDPLDTWKAMEALVDEGLVKSIGLSNFNSVQIKRICEGARIQPAMLQIECHPYLNQKSLINFCHERNIAVTAYSPLGSNDRPWAKPDDPKLMDDPRIVQISEKHKKSSAQILIRYQIQRNVIVIPKSVTAERIKSNFEVFNFELDSGDMSLIDSIDCNGRLCVLGWISHHPHYPFKGVDF